MNKRKIISLLVAACFLFDQAGMASAAVHPDSGPVLAGLAANNAPPAKFRPPHLRSLGVDPRTNRLNVLIDKGDSRNPAVEAAASGQALMKYFFIGLALPESALWVNLRPGAPDDMLDPDMARTDLGKVLLAADLRLKRDCAAFTSPKTPEGREYWRKLRAKARQIYGDPPSSLATLARPWIVPGEIIVSESRGTAHIYKATLKVLLEQDYLKGSAAYSFYDERRKQLNAYSGELLRELVIPRLTVLVNSGKHYADFRQAYYSLILAQWFKRSAVLAARPYAFRADSRDLSGLVSAKQWDKAEFFGAYRKSFEQGEYSFSESEAGSVRTYCQGGIQLAGKLAAAINERITTGAMGREPGYAAYCLEASVTPDGRLFAFADGGSLLPREPSTDAAGADGKRESLGTGRAALPGRFRVEARRRQARAAAALASGRVKGQTVNMYVINANGFGLIGSAAMIAEDLSRSGVKVNVYIEEAQFTVLSNIFKQFNSHDLVNLIPLSRTAVPPAAVHPAAAHVVVSWGDISFLDGNDGVYAIDSFANMLKGQQVKLPYGSVRGSNNLGAAEGALFFDRSLRERKTRKDESSQEEIILKRENLLSQLLGEPGKKKLGAFAREQGWEPARAIWSFGYIQDSRAFTAEIELIAQWLSSGRDLPFINGGKQVVVPLVCGEIVRRSAGRVPGFAGQLRKSGVTVMLESGEILEADPDQWHRKIPVTVVVRSRVDNALVKTLLSEATGTLIRDPSDSFWVDFPVFITGGASWLEAMSAGDIYLHDNYDTWPGALKPSLELALARQLALEDQRGDRSWKSIEAEAGTLVDAYLMGQPGHSRLYQDLAQWTRDARKHGRVLMEGFNISDEIIGYLGAAGRERPDGGDNDAGWVEWMNRSGGRYMEGVRQAYARGEIVFTYAIGEGETDGWSHFSHLSDANTRPFSRQAARLYRFQVLKNREQPLMALEAGGGMGRACSQMKQIAGRLGVDAEIHYNGLFPVNPMLTLNKSMGEVAGFLMGNAERFRGKARYFHGYAPSPFEITLDDLIDLDEQGAGILDHPRIPYVNRQIIGKFLPASFPARYDFIFDQLGGVYYSPKGGTVEKICGLLSDRGIFYFEYANHLEEWERLLPEEAVAVEFVNQQSLLVTKRTSPMFRAIAFALGNPEYARQAGPNVYEVEDLDEFLSFIESEDGDPARLERLSGKMADWRLHKLVMDVYAGDEEATRRLRRYWDSGFVEGQLKKMEYVYKNLADRFGFIPKDGGRGGIDLRGMGVRTGAQAPGKAYPLLSITQIEKEQSDLERLLATGVTPAADRVERLAGACASGGVMGRFSGGLRSLVASILRLEEERGLDSDPALRLAFSLLEAS